MGGAGHAVIVEAGDSERVVSAGICKSSSGAFSATYGGAPLPGFGWGAGEAEYDTYTRFVYVNPGRGTAGGLF